MERAGIAGQDHASELGQTRRIGFGDRQRIAHAGGARPMHGMTKDRSEIGLESARLVTIELATGQAEFLGQLELGPERKEGRVAAVELQPTLPAQIAGGAGIRQQGLVLRKRAGKQRAHDARGVDQALRMRRGPEGHEPRHRLRQMAQMVVRFRSTLERDAQQRRKARRKSGWKDRVALDDAGIAVGGLLARRPPVHEPHPQTPFGELERDRGTDDAGPEHDCIGACHDVLLREAGVPAECGRPPFHCPP